MADANVFETKHFIEAALLASPEPLSIDQLQRAASARPGASETPKSEVREALKALTEDYEGRGVELLEVASGFRIQVRSEMGRELVALFEERPPRYSRAFFETLALIAYRQPITRGEIEDVRGVAVSSNIIRNMMEREWIRIVGHRDVPGKPAMFGTTKAFLDYFNLKSLDELPSLAELTDIESLRIQLDLPTVDDGTGQTADAPAEASDGDAMEEAVADADEDEAPAEDTADADNPETASVARQEHG
ncbi:MAG: SMC-Scp complex subunit ScpB [Pseudomonadota bacterium]